MSQTQEPAIAAPAAVRWKPYPAYKPSGVEWLGGIPVHWEVKKIKRLCLVKRGASPRPIDDPIYFDDDGEYAWVRISDVSASTKYLQSTEQKLSELGRSKSVSLEPGELFLSIAATVGKPIITTIKCCIHDGFVYFVGLKENREYLFYLFSGGELYKGLGKLGTQLNLNTDTIGDIRIPVPPLPEQRAIAAFLDRETAKLDTLVAQKERLIELLREKRAAIISHAVTKGLVPAAPLKDSGVPWLGQIPAHWEIKPVWMLFNLGRGRVISNIEIQDNPGPYPVFSSQTENDGVLGHISTYEFEGTYLTWTTDGANAGTVFYRQGKFNCTNVCGTLFPKQDDTELRFFRYVLNEATSWYVRHDINPKLMNGVMARIRVHVPPPAEQQAIALFLDRETAKIDHLISVIRAGIQILQEERAALIAAAVTGKIDVREAEDGEV